MVSSKRPPSSVERVRSLFSQITFAITVILGGLTTLSLLEEPSKTLQPVLPGAVARGPAAISDETPKTVSMHDLMSTLEVGCDIQEIHTPSPHVRLKGSACIEQEIDSSAVTNETNRMPATVFAQGLRNYSTDYIPLEMGENHIVIESHSRSGEVVRRDLKVVRQ